MKIYFVIALQFSIVSSFIYGQTNPVSGTELEKSFEVVFTLPKYNLRDTLLNYSGVNKTFAIISCDQLGVTCDSAMPMLPQYTLSYGLPDDVTEYFVSEVIEDAEVEDTIIQHKILPYQHYPLVDQVFPIQYDSIYFASNGSNYCSQKYSVNKSGMFGVKGIYFTIYPFQYIPNENKLIITKKCKFVIKHNGTKNRSSNARSTVQEQFLQNVYENYLPTSRNIGDKGTLLILTPDIFRRNAEVYAQYKRSLEYRVYVHNTDSDGIQRNAAEIKEIIRSYYNDVDRRPDFVLIIGDIDRIPASSGFAADKDNPLTDWNYCRMVGKDFWGADDYFGDFWIGRFSVSTVSDLIILINKIVHQERILATTERSALLLSGGGKYENTFEEQCRDISDKGVKPNGYSTGLLLATSDNTSEQLRNALNTWDYHLMVYFGHGNSIAIGNPFLFGRTSIEGITNLDNHPFFISAACLNGNYGLVDTLGLQAPCLGESWLRLQTGGVAFFGGSSNTYPLDGFCVKKILTESYFGYDRLGIIIAKGKEDFYKQNKQATRFDRGITMRRLNLLGDPSMYVRGIGCVPTFVFSADTHILDSCTFTYHAGNNILFDTENGVFVVDSGANMTMMAENEIEIRGNFDVMPGAVFDASIVECNVNTNKSAKVTITNGVNLEHKLAKVKSAKDTTDLSVQVYPNPTEMTLNFKFYSRNNAAFFVNLYDNNSKLILNIPENKVSKGVNIKTIDIKALHPGIYHYRIFVNDKVFSGKILKTN